MKVKIKTWKQVDLMEEEMPSDRIIDVVDGYWNEWMISGDMVEYVIADMGETK